MHLELHIRHWVLWWFGIGVALGAIALANILGQNLTRPQDDLILILGIMHWTLGGLVCWALDGVHVAKAERLPETRPLAPKKVAEHEWHPASDFVLPGTSRHLLPPEYFAHPGAGHSGPHTR